LHCDMSIEITEERTKRWPENYQVQYVFLIVVLLSLRQLYPKNENFDSNLPLSLEPRIVTCNLPVHSIQSALQILLQPCSAMPVCLLRSWILCSPATTALRNRNSRPLVLSLLAWLDSHVLSEPMDLVQDHFPHLSNIFYNLKIKVEGCGATRLVRGIMPDVQVRMLESSLNGDSGRWIEC
jgi:hypothetical protein